jgi:BirA family biotin operon repressor/biotin-[acetyl-CoA-carboxylase] ligase
MSGDTGDGLRRLLLGRGLAWPAPIHAFPVIDSTSLWLKAAARAGAAPWTVVLAGEQTAGRGRHGREWMSPRGGLYLSVLLDRPHRMDPTRPGPLALLGGVAVARALCGLGLDARLKWPNDVRVRGRKIAGLLVDSVMRSGAPVYVLGVGVNVDWPEAVLPESLQGSVTALRLERAPACDVLGLAAAVLTELAVCYDALARQGAGVVVEQWRGLSEPWWGRPVEMRVGEKRVRGIALDVAEDGALVIEQEDAGRCAWYAGEVEELRPQIGARELDACS